MLQKYGYKIGLGIVLIFAVLQLFQIEKTNPPVNAAQDLIQSTNPPAEVAGILKNACYDCHSHETVYPWYTSLQPFAWSIQNHIQHARKHVNFSEYGSLSSGDRSEMLNECAEEVLGGSMPIASYKLMHPEAQLTDAHRKLLADWFKSVNRGSSPDHPGTHSHEEIEED